MRDLEADLRLSEQLQVTSNLLSVVCSAWSEAIKRAIAAEDRVDKLEDEIRLLHDALNQSNKA